MEFTIVCDEGLLDQLNALLNIGVYLPDGLLVGSAGGSSESTLLKPLGTSPEVSSSKSIKVARLRGGGRRQHRRGDRHEHRQPPDRPCHRVCAPLGSGPARRDPPIAGPSSQPDGLLERTTPKGVMDFGPLVEHSSPVDHALPPGIPPPA